MFEPVWETSRKWHAKQEELFLEFLSMPEFKPKGGKGDGIMERKDQARWAPLLAAFSEKVVQLNTECPQTTFTLPSQPFKENAPDRVGPPPVTLGKDSLLNMTDRLTAFVVCIPCEQSMTKTHFAHALHHGLFCVHGSPRVIISDSDPHIDNDYMWQLETLQRVSHRFTVPANPKGNGQPEAINKAIVTRLRMHCSGPPRAQK
jgi:hypothetical protein